MSLRPSSVEFLGRLQRPLYDAEEFRFTDRIKLAERLVETGPSVTAASVINYPSGGGYAIVIHLAMMPMVAFRAKGVATTLEDDCFPKSEIPGKMHPMSDVYFARILDLWP